MCGALLVPYPLKTTWEKMHLRTVASESRWSRLSSVLALDMRAGRDVGGGRCGGSLLTVDARSVLNTRQKRGVGCGHHGGSLFTVDVRSVLNKRQ